MKKLRLLSLLFLAFLHSSGQTNLVLNDYPLTGPYTIVTLDSAVKLFHLIEKTPIIQFGYTRGGCDYRAHAVYQLLKNMGISTFKVWNFPSAKVFLGGRDFNKHRLLLRVKDKMNLGTSSPFYKDCKIDVSDDVYWGYRVAPAILVKSQDITDTLVIDPALFDHPVNYRAWVSSQLQSNGSSYVIFMDGKYISFQKESQFQHGSVTCSDCSGNDIFTGVFFDDAYSIENKLTEQSLGKGRIFVEYYLAEVQPKEAALQKMQPSDPAARSLACDLATQKQYLSDENNLGSLPPAYRNRIDKYVKEATAALFNK